jgi:LPS-assembly lipoprotein
MSSSERARPAALRSLAILGLAALLPACTVAPLYGTGDRQVLPSGATTTVLADMRGKIAVSAANDRTTQVVRNALLFRLNGGTTPVAPVYEIRNTVSGGETVVSIQAGSGVPSASSYRMTVSYQVVRLADQKVIATGSRFAVAPFDRSSQLFASSRALIDAREQAGRSVAEKVELAVVAAIRKDLVQ